MDALKKYWAFLSYSHQDAKVCEWLHQSLEAFRIPRRLVGRDTREGKIPARLFPIFRDRDELPGSSELGKNLTEALAQSRYLIVICSPSAARSRWVNEEIRQFKMMGGEGRILALIMDGEPNAADKPNSGLLECFPEALKYRVDASGNLTNQRVEPIAADIRKGRESKSMSLLRLIAGLLGVPFDELRQRERERARRTAVIRVVASVTLISLLAGGLFWRYRQDRMERLEELGREALMQSQPTHAAVFLAETYRMGNDSRDVRIMLDQAMRSVDMLTSVHADDPEGYSSAMFSDDGTRLIASSKTGNVTVWRADNGQRLLRLKADAASSRYARFLPGGREIALLYQDGRVEIIDARSGGKLREGSVPKGFKPNLDPSHSFIAVYRQSGNNDRWSDRAARLLIYDLQTLQVRREINQPCAAYLSPISADGQNYFCILTGDATGVLVYAINSAAPARQILPGVQVSRITLSQDGRYAFASAGNGALTVVSLLTQKIVLTGSDPAGGVPRLAITNDGQFIASAGETGTVLVWSLATGQLHAAIAAHVSRIKAAYFLDNGNRLATLGYDGTLKIWNLQNSTLISVAEPRSGYLVRSALSPEAGKMVTFADPSTDLNAENIAPTLKVWDLLSAGPISSLGNARSVEDSELSETRNRAIFHGNPASTVWDVPSGKKLFESSERLQSRIATNAEGSRTATVSGVTNLNSGKKEFSFAGHAKVSQAIWSHDGNFVASVSEELIKVWDVKKGAATATIARDTPAAEVALSANGKRLAVISAGGATLFDTQTGGKIAESNDSYGDVQWVEASLDGPLFRLRTSNAMIEIDANTAKSIRRHDNLSRFGGPSACKQRVRLDSRADNTMVVTDLAGKKPPAILSGHNGLYDYIDCDRAMQFYLTGGTTGAAVLWNAETQKPILRFVGHARNIGGVGFLAEPGQLVTTGADGTFLKWAFEEERRNPGIISRRIACRVPLRLDGYILRPISSVENACGKRGLQ